MHFAVCSMYSRLKNTQSAFSGSKVAHRSLHSLKSMSEPDGQGSDGWPHVPTLVPLPVRSGEICVHYGTRRSSIGSGAAETSDAAADRRAARVDIARRKGKCERAGDEGVWNGYSLEARSCW